ncbi:hypothetical protein D7X30_04390 [Corallococcus sp. AB011P]|uniref:hypothetical protein n=1 Tax=unclassified Corallococcus TaxID=2685029 RepID=UPI000EA0098E|nr:MULTISPECIES: hypothetical protein [unclassified Corallococcus]RKG62531.1 hypothetical protein D7X30_04390 [Corallococcus sp. AB011P]RKH91385.1 hypothetical protein D7Y21_03190 [Corallococcus sp. AB045]
MRPSLPAHALLLLLTLTASACVPERDWVMKEGPAESLTLTASSPSAHPRLRVQATGRKGSGVEVSLVDIAFVVEPRWELPGETSTGPRPWHRVRIVDERDDKVLGEYVFVLMTPNVPGVMKLGFPVSMEDSASQLDVTYRLELDWQGAPAEGAIQVGWKPQVTVETGKEDTDDVEFTFTSL